MRCKLFITNSAFMSVIDINIEIVKAETSFLALFLNIHLYNILFYNQYNILFMVFF